MSHTDPQDDIPCTACETEGSRSRLDEDGLCPDCRTPAGRLVTALAARGVKAKADTRCDVSVDILAVTVEEEEWTISSMEATHVETVNAAADAIAAIVKATTPDPFAGFRDHLQSKAIKDHAALLSDHAHLVTQSDGAMDALRPHTSHANICRAAEDVVGRMVAAEAERDTLAASVAALEAHNGRMVAAWLEVASACDAARNAFGSKWGENGGAEDVACFLPGETWAKTGDAIRDLAGGAS